ncbi:Heat shock protein 70 family - like 10 [Theobroma cacao]|nr:Heat shock protein 70 family - like 10 [Theobroma cacao]
MAINLMVHIFSGFDLSCAHFKEQYNIDVYSNVRACIRLRAACEKLKKVLSANAEAPLNIECLMDEKDVKGFIRREEFEKLASQLLERINIPCIKALADAGLTVEKIHAVELVGSGSRIPAITRQLASLFRREPGRTINASECVARGCALQCAMLSPVFRVRDYEIGPFQSSHIERARVKVKVQLNLHGIVTVESAILIEEHVDDSITREDTHSEMSTKEAQHVTNSSEDSTTVRSKPSHASADGRPNDKATRRLEIPICENIYGAMTKAELIEAQDKELKLAQHDRTMEQTKERKNALESYVYEMRNKLFNSYRSFASDEEKEGISKSLQETEEWLYEDGEDETEGAYTSKLEDLKKLVDPVESRYKDEEARAQASSDLLKCIVDYRMSTKALPNEDRELIINECNKAEEWLREKTQQQDSLPKNIDPLLWSSAIKSRTEDLNMKYKHITHKASHPDSENKGWGQELQLPEDR